MNNKKVIGLILGTMCLILSYGIAAQIKMTNSIGTTISTNDTENKLRDEILKSKEKYDNLYRALEDADNQLETERTNATQNNGELTDLESSIKEGNKTLGLTEVTGEGVIVTLNDIQKVSLNSYFGDPNNGMVHFNDVIRIVNELKNSGAEAISINDQRVILTTSIECDGSVIKVNGVKVAAPFEIKAIGFTANLMSVNRFGGYLMFLKDFGVETSITRADNITIPKYTGVIKFNYAQSK